MSIRRTALVLFVLALATSALWIGWRFNGEMQRARAHAAQGSVLVPPRCGPIEIHTMMRLFASDFLFWSALHLTRNPVTGFALATPPRLLTTASPQERARVNEMLDNILPVSARAEGLRSDTAAGKHLAPAALASIRAPTLIISARDDRYGTYASAQYTAGQIAGAKFIGFKTGGHTWVGHGDEVRAEIVKLVVKATTP